MTFQIAKRRFYIKTVKTVSPFFLNRNHRFYIELVRVQNDWRELYTSAFTYNLLISVNIYIEIVNEISILQDKFQLLFIGDSTNRGMMYELMETLNTSLTSWDKTHNIKRYEMLNQRRTVTSFSYYPQFWLPVQERPVFDKSLYRLIKRYCTLFNWCVYSS